MKWAVAGGTSLAGVQPSSAEGYPCSAYGSGWQRAPRPCPPLMLPFVVSGMEPAAWGVPGPGPRPPWSHRLCRASAGALVALRVAGQGRVSLGASLALQSGLFSGF